ncbi:MAG: hypothetical protein F2942_02905, partial [Actinobacteria bacterium]|nr:hypothetical protein [Actinomycetota bacterium]
MTRTSMVWRSAVVLAGIAVIAAGCSSDKKAESSDSGATFTDGAQLIAENLTSYDPGLVQTLDESQVTTALYDGLTDF